MPIRPLIQRVAKKGMVKAMHGHGIGRHNDQEILKLAAQQLQALSDLLGEKDYFFNEQISSIDICAYAMLAEIFLVPLSSPLLDLAEQYPNLKRFCENIHTTYF